MILKRLGILATTIALAVLAFPISTAQAKKEPQIIFAVGQGTEPRLPFGPPVPAPKPQPKRLKVVKTGFNPCNCVSYTRFRTGVNVGSIGVARNHPVNTQTPSVGAIVVTYESKAGHLATVVALDDQFIYVDEANYTRCKVTHKRAILRTSKLIKGYYV